MADNPPQPGEVIIPIERDSPVGPAVVAASVEVPATTPEPVQPQPAVTPAAPPPPTTEVPPAVQPTGGFAAQPMYAQPSPEGVSWRAAEFASNEKFRGWYGLTLVGSVIISVIIYFLNRDIVTAAIVFIALAGLAYFSGRKPREQDFMVTNEGVSVGRSYYPFQDFRSFAVSEDATATSLILIPLKRFMPAINIYVPAAYEQAVMEIVAQILPFEQHHVDIVDSFMRRIRF